MTSLSVNESLGSVGLTRSTFGEAGSVLTFGKRSFKCKIFYVIHLETWTLANCILCFLGLKTLHSVRSRNSRYLRCSCSSSLVYDDTRNSFVRWYCWWVPQWTCVQTEGLLTRDFLKQHLPTIFLRAYVKRVRFQRFLPVDLLPLLCQLWSTFYNFFIQIKLFGY